MGQTLDYYDEFDFSFVPATAGTYRIYSEHFLANLEFEIEVKEVEGSAINPISTLFSNALILSSDTSVTEIDAGDQIEIEVELLSHEDEGLTASQMNTIYQECNLIDQSGYTLDGEWYGFEQQTM